MRPTPLTALGAGVLLEGVAVLAAGVFALQVAAEFEPATISDWRTWAVALGSGAVRAAAAAVLSRR